MGSLGMKNFKRKRIDDMQYMKNLIQYIHNNPLESRLSKTLDSYAYSSYSTILKNENSFIKSNEVLEWYFDLNNFITCHHGNTGIILHEN